MAPGARSSVGSNGSNMEAAKPRLSKWDQRASSNSNGVRGGALASPNTEGYPSRINASTQLERARGSMTCWTDQAAQCGCVSRASNQGSNTMSAASRPINAMTASPIQGLLRKDRLGAWPRRSSGSRIRQWLSRRRALNQDTIRRSLGRGLTARPHGPYAGLIGRFVGCLLQLGAATGGGIRPERARTHDREH